MMQILGMQFSRTYLVIISISAAAYTNKYQIRLPEMLFQLSFMKLVSYV